MHKAENIKRFYTVYNVQSKNTSPKAAPRLVLSAIFHIYIRKNCHIRKKSDMAVLYFDA